MKLTKKIATHSKQFSEIAAKHILEHKSPTEYGLLPTDVRGLIKKLAQEVEVNPEQLGSFGELATKQVNGGTFLVSYYDIAELLEEELGYDPDQLAKRVDKADGYVWLWKFYIQFIAKGLEYNYKLKMLL